MCLQQHGREDSHRRLAGCGRERAAGGCAQVISGVKSLLNVFHFALNGIDAFNSADDVGGRFAGDLAQRHFQIVVDFREIKFAAQIWAT
jgi:hypothetical protein